MQRKTRHGHARRVRHPRHLRPRAVVPRAVARPHVRVQRTGHRPRHGRPRGAGQHPPEPVLRKTRARLVPRQRRYRTGRHQRRRLGRTQARHQLRIIRTARAQHVVRRAHRRRTRRRRQTQRVPRTDQTLHVLADVARIHLSHSQYNSATQRHRCTQPQKVSPHTAGPPTNHEYTRGHSSILDQSVEAPQASVIASASVGISQYTFTCT